MHNEMYTIYTVEANHSFDTFMNSCIQHIHNNFIIIHKQIQLQNLNEQEYLSLEKLVPQPAMSLQRST